MNGCARFESWIADTDPQALLNAVIFFDFRLLHGREELAERLRERLPGRAAARRDSSGRWRSRRSPCGRRSACSAIS